MPVRPLPGAPEEREPSVLKAPPIPSARHHPSPQPIDTCMYGRHILLSMEPRQVVWRDHNLRHITIDHPERGITQGDVDDVLADTERREEPDATHETMVPGDGIARELSLWLPWSSCPTAPPFPCTHAGVGAGSRGRTQE